MGAIKRKLLVYFFLFSFLFVNSQIIKLEKGDKFKLIEKEEFKENGVTFYKNEYNLIIYNKDNIKFNKEKGYKPQIMAGGLEICNKCKKEVYHFSVKKLDKPPQKNLKIKPLCDLFTSLKSYSFGGSYFLINDTYYRNLGMPVE